MEPFSYGTMDEYHNGYFGIQLLDGVDQLPADVKFLHIGPQCFLSYFVKGLSEVNKDMVEFYPEFWRCFLQRVCRLKIFPSESHLVLPL